MGKKGEPDKVSNQGWRARYQYRGKRYSKTFRTKGQAQSWWEHEQELIRFGKWTPPAEREKQAKHEAEQRARTVAILMQDWLARPNIKESTRQTNTKTVQSRICDVKAIGAAGDVIRAFVTKPVVDVRRGDVFAWWDALQKIYPKSATENNRAYKALHAAFNRAVRMELIGSNPVNLPEASKRPTPKSKYLPERWELQKILDNVDTRYKAVTSLIFFHGLRIGEALALELEDIQLDGNGGGTIHVRRNFQRIKREMADGEKRYCMVLQTPKTASGYREVPIMGATHAAILEAQINEMKTAGLVEVHAETGTAHLNLLTRTATGQAMMDTSYRNVLNRVKGKTGVDKRIHPHCGRYWLVTMLAELDASPKEVGSILGQSDLRTILETYTQVRKERPQQLMKKSDKREWAHEPE